MVQKKDLLPLPLRLLPSTQPIQHHIYTLISAGYVMSVSSEERSKGPWLTRTVKRFSTASTKG